MKNTLRILRYAGGIPLYILGACLTAAAGGKIYGPLVFFLMAIGETACLYLESGRIFDLRILFTLSWICGIALSGFQLSKLQSVWTIQMWSACGLFYFLFLAAWDGFGIIRQVQKRKAHGRTGKTAQTPEIRTEAENAEFRKYLFAAICIIAGLGLTSFLIECIKFDFVLPVMSDKPHAYTEFHITGLHYFVVSLMFVHPLSVVWLMSAGKKNRTVGIILIVLNTACILVPVVLLSKFQLCIALALPIMTWMLLQNRLSRRKILLIVLAAGIVGCALFAFMISERKYPEGYLQRIFRFKNAGLPLWLQYPYIYIVNNFENLNLLTVKLQHYSLGVRELYPAFALTGAKFLSGIKNLMNVEVYFTKEELTTLTLLYDAYGDFGLAGTAGFGLLLGVASAGITELWEEKRTLIGLLLYIQFAIYLALAFFSTWFSNPTTWFWLIASAAVSLFVNRENGKITFRQRRICGR